MLCKVRSLGLQGISGYEVTAECDLAGGLPNFDIVGLPDTAVKEARERVRAAIKNSGYAFPVGRITVNLAPANRRKSGTVYDLPILLGILALAVLYFTAPYTGVYIPVSRLSVAVSAVLGVPGVTLLVLLSLL